MTNNNTVPVKRSQYPPDYDPTLHGLVRWMQWFHAGVGVVLIPIRNGSTWSHLIVMLRDGKRTVYSYENNRLIPLTNRV